MVKWCQLAVFYLPELSEKATLKWSFLKFCNTILGCGYCKLQCDQQAGEKYYVEYHVRKKNF